MKVKYIPKITVKVRAWIVSFCLFSKREWWAHVTVTPDERRIDVFKRGIEKGLIGVIPTGGQVHPISIFGANLLWRKPQKNAAKKRTSDKINKIIPNRRLIDT